MAAVKWFRVRISVDKWERVVYLYQTQSNLFDLQYHWMYTSRMHDSLQDALKEFGREFTRQHGLPERNLQLSVAEPVEVQWGEVEHARPVNQPSPYFDPP